MSDNEVNEDVNEELFEDALDELLDDTAEKIDVEMSETVAKSVTDEDLVDQVKSAESRALRAQAELENFRNRARRESEDKLKYATQPLLSDLLPVIDNVYRAVAAASQDEASGGLLEGVLLVAQQLIDVLERHNCTRIEAVGQVFDPNFHEAIQQMPSEEQPAGHVAQAVQEGYKLHDRVIRPSTVIVSTGPAEG